MSAFHLAARHGDTEALEILLASEKVNINSVDKVRVPGVFPSPIVSLIKVFIWSGVCIIV